jgi:Kef-type K+ transport system membrane component KefB
MSFGVLCVLVLAGLAGPLLGTFGSGIVPVVVGELLAGLVLGRSGFGWIDPEQATTAFLANVGFAMVMFSAGLHVPLGRPGLGERIGRGARTAVVAAVLAAAAGWAIAHATHVGRPWTFAVVLASGSAAVLVPALDEAGLLAVDAGLVVAAQVAIADVASIVAVPLVLRPGRATDALVGTAVVAGCAIALLLFLRTLRGRAWVHRVRRLSKQRRWALDLRLSLVVLFALCWAATRAGTSILVAGFAVGLVVAAVGGPKRLSRQVTGVAEGFFAPLFFVVLGASIDVRALARDAHLIELAALLAAANVALHLVAALVTRQSWPAGLAASVQLGVPAAVVALGLEEHVLSSGEGAAVLAAALISIGVSSAGVAALARPRPVSPP